MPKYPLSPWLLWVSGAASALTLVVVGACSSSSNAVAPPAQCNANPWLCDALQTCWPTACVCPSGQASCDSSSCIAQFSCEASVSGKNPYDACRNSPTSVTCGDHQACVEFSTDTGVCLSYCDPADPQHACAPNQQCLPYKVGQAASAPMINVCITNKVDSGMPSDDGGSMGDTYVPVPDGAADGAQMNM